MIALATMFVTYLWHYVVARLLYDTVIRPLAIGAVLIACLALLLRRRAR